MKEEIVSDIAAYQLLCTLGPDGMNNAFAAREWLRATSWYNNSRVVLTDGTELVRDGLGYLIHVTRAQ